MNTIKTVVIISKGDLFLHFLNMTILKPIYVKASFLNNYPLNLLSTFNFIQTTINKIREPAQLYKIPGDI